MAIKKMQVKTMLRFHLTLVRIVTTKNINKNKYWREWGGKETLIHCWLECKLVQPLWKSVWSVLRKLKIVLLYDPAIPFLGTYLKECISNYNKGTFTLMFILALFTVDKLWKQTRYANSMNVLRKYGIYIQWNFIQPQRRMKFCHLQVNESNWRTSS
jgi:hypothetical protein